jgi:non-heme chloroperoxidase
LLRTVVSAVAASGTGRQPVVFVHGLWLLPTSWDRWAALFEEAGHVALTPGWPDDPDTVADKALGFVKRFV